MNQQKIQKKRKIPNFFKLTQSNYEKKENVYFLFILKKNQFL